MLSGAGNPVSTVEAATVESRVLDIVAETGGFDREDVSLSTPLAAALDSLTLAAAVTRVEASFGIVLTGDEIVALLGACDLGELCRLIAVRVARAHANLDENTGNESC
jgi:acyl carrier protein